MPSGQVLGMLKQMKEVVLHEISRVLWVSFSGRYMPMPSLRKSACRACHMDVPIHLDHFSLYQRYLLRDIEMNVGRRWNDHDHQISIH